VEIRLYFNLKSKSHSLSAQMRQFRGAKGDYQPIILRVILRYGQPLGDVCVFGKL